MPAVRISPAGMRIMRLLIGKQPLAIADLVREAGVTRTAVAEQLNELVAADLVRQATERLPGRGRPRNLYSATNAAMLLLSASDHQRIFPTLWKTLYKVGGPQLIEKVLEQITKDLADYYREKIKGTTPKQRLHEFVALLREEGGLLEIVEENGEVLLHKRSCPFISMLDENQSVCCIDKEMMATVIGEPVQRVASRHEGAPCCVFELFSSNEKH